MNPSIIVAIAENHAIGKNNQLLWHLPADLKHFKAVTSGHPVVMGRKTFESIGKPLPNRRNIVISRQAGLSLPGAEVCGSLEAALSLCGEKEEVFIIGGAEIYRAALPVTQRIYLTTVHAHFEGDAFFPVLDPQEWVEKEAVYHAADEKNTLPCTFSVLERK